VRNELTVIPVERIKEVLPAAFHQDILTPFALPVPSLASKYCNSPYCLVDFYTQ
jgi:predicted ATP-dependent protease